MLWDVRNVRGAAGARGGGPRRTRQPERHALHAHLLCAPSALYANICVCVCVRLMGCSVTGAAGAKHVKAAAVGLVAVQSACAYLAFSAAERLAKKRLLWG